MNIEDDYPIDPHPCAIKKHTRVRRGKEVLIPQEWLGKVTTPATIRQRPSKLIGKLKRLEKPNVAYKDAKDLPIEDE